MMDGTFVKELADRLQLEPMTLRLADGRELVFRPSGDDWEILKTPEPQTLVLHTLQGLVDYLASAVDLDARTDTDTIIQVVGPERVVLRGAVDTELLGGRPCLAQVVFDDGLQRFSFNHWRPAEEFIIGLQALFVPTPARDELLRLVSSIRSGDVRENTDNGYAQEVKATKGVALVTNVAAPTRVKLQPYRTFREVEQPESEFVLRLSATQEQKPQILLAEADGGAWRLEAVKRVAEWLRRELSIACPAGDHLGHLHVIA